MQTFITNNFEETQRIAEEFVKSDLGKRDSAMVVCLYGDLGFGKTTFVQGMAKGLGIEKKILSPTFIILRSYEIKAKSQNPNITSQNLKTFYHVDLYRLNSEEEILDLGLLDILQNPENIVAIEWPEKMGSLLPEKHINIRIEYLENDRRKIII